MIFYVSRYALTNGVQRIDAQERGEYAIVDQWTMLRIGSDLHREESDAIAAAEAARVKKIKSLQKQIAKLEALSFDPRYEPTPAGRALLEGEG